MPDENILIDNNSDDKVQGKKSMSVACNSNANEQLMSLLVNSHVL